MLSARNRKHPTILAIFTSGTMTRFIFGNLSKPAIPIQAPNIKQTRPIGGLALLAEVCEIASLFSPKIFLNI